MTPSRLKFTIQMLKHADCIREQFLLDLFVIQSIWASIEISHFSVDIEIVMVDLSSYATS